MNTFLKNLPVIGVFVFLMGPAVYFHQYWLALVFLVFGICFGLIELIAIKVTGKTVSKHFWEFRDTHPKSAWLIAISMILAWSCLIFHFMIQG